MERNSRRSSRFLFRLISIVLVMIMTLSQSVIVTEASPASFFDTDLDQGRQRFVDVVNESTDDTAVFYEREFTSDPGSTFSVAGSDGSTVYVRATKDGAPVSFDLTYKDTYHEDTFYYHGWSVDAKSWTQVVDRGIRFEFFEDSGYSTPLEVNAFGVQVQDWGTCCLGPNYTPTGTASGTAIYTMFDGGTVGSQVELLGNITSTISSTFHFVAEIDDREQSFTEVTVSPNGDGEAFRMGGYVIFSVVPQDSVPPGSGSTPSIPPERPDLILSSDLGDSGTDNLTADTTPTFSVTFSPQNDIDFINLYDGSTLIATSGIAGTTTPTTIEVTSSELSAGSHTITAKVENGYWHDESDASLSLTINIDDSAPGMTVTSPTVSDGDTTNDSSIQLSFSSTESTTTFTSSDVTVTNGVLSSFSGSGTSYSATLTPSSDGEVTVSVGSGSYTDYAGNENTASNVFTWTSDQTVPTITFNPKNTETIVANEADIILTMSEPMRRAVDDADLTDSNIDAHLTLKFDNAGGIDIPFDATIDTENQVITINPNSALPSNSDIYVAVDGGLEDTAGNALPASSALFNTADETIPTLSSSSPSDGQTDVLIDSSIVLTFSEAVYAQSGNIEIRKTSDGSLFEGIPVGSGQVTGSGTDTITVSPGSLFASYTDYYVLIDATAFDDVDGNDYSGISDAEKLNFRTEYIDIYPPTVTFTPADGAAGVSQSANIILTFDEAIRRLDDSPLDDSNVDALLTLKENDASGANIPFDATIDGTKQVITINPNSNFSSEQVVYVAIGATVEDSSDNALVPDNATFTVDDTVAPDISSLTPADEATGVSASANLVIQFTEDVNAQFGTIKIRKASDNSIVESISVVSVSQISGDGTDTITINPANMLEASTQYYVQIDSTAFEDDAGNPFPGISDTTTWNFTTSSNTPPEAVDDTASTDEDTPITTGNVLSNDSDEDPGDTLTVSSMDTSSTVGSVTNNGNGTFDYDPNGQFGSLESGDSTTDTFTYTISDGNGGNDTATVTVTISGVNHPPIGVDDSDSTDEDTAFTTGNVLTNDTDSDNDTLSVTALDTSGTTGSVTNNGNGTFDYDPNGQYDYLNPGDSTTDTFSYTVSDGNGGTDTATVTITITGLTEQPTANDDTSTATEDITITTVNVLFNDTDPDTGEVLFVASFDTTGTIGLVTNNGDGTFLYNPNGQFESLAEGDSDTDSFDYTVSDGNGGTDTATVTITVTGVNDAPEAEDDSDSTAEDTPVTINVLSNDSDVDNLDVFTVVVVTNGVHGTVVNNTNDVTYTPAANYHGIDLFNYTIEDSQGGADTATVEVTITAADDIQVYGNSQLIPDGDTTPAAGDDTGFGGTALFTGSIVKTFTISNPSAGNALLTSSPRISISGTDAGDFTVTQQPSASIPAGGDVTFTVEFVPQDAGTRSAVLSFECDLNEDPFTFAIQGTGADDDRDNDGILDSVEGDGDRDHDSVPNYADYDPAGYFYNEQNAEIISGGLVSVTGPGAINLVENGSDGYYQFTTDGTPGTYTIEVSLPPGYGWSNRCERSDPPPFDPTGSPEDPVVLGNGEDGSTGYLTSSACTPFYLTFDLSAGDPEVINNNFALRKLPLPVTGFAPGQITDLPAQPDSLAYESSDLWLEIPSIDISTRIVGVPAVDGNWDVTWLAEEAGYLDGTAFPTTSGNTVITGHVWDALNQPGIFARLRELHQGDVVNIHAWNKVYTYEVRSNRLIIPQETDVVMSEKELDWVTLFTCEGYRTYMGEYLYRRAVQAVLIDVTAAE